MTDHDDFAALRAALKAGPTPGPWDARTFADHDGPPSCDDIQVNADSPCGTCNGPILAMDWRETPKTCDFPRDAAERTAAYIASASHEVIARLLAELDALRVAAQQARDKALEEATHACRKRRMGDGSIEDEEAERCEEAILALK